MASGRSDKKRGGGPRKEVDISVALLGGEKLLGTGSKGERGTKGKPTGGFLPA